MLSAARRDSHPGLNELDLGVKTTVIDFARSRVLNARSDQGSLQDVLGKNEASIAMISDADHELIISLVFKDPTTITNVTHLADPPTSGPPN
ncbi:PITH domain protein [Gregarina niphandrodes]|uniref:PITH domain protein n=1 Tax=Gregarina niphandrodes TaxID=110365 RepID=A0A023BBG7_GRENI|nr:PITH domain protein [Gregarina niphandrodes]EZG79714.1 PITH domain protein [Gregarina niphandrodes]|eukprot:XP_011134396.1 PITH domain protein [Gregarina niphandrodes]